MIVANNRLKTGTQIKERTTAAKAHTKLWMPEKDVDRTWAAHKKRIRCLGIGKDEVAMRLNGVE